MDKSFLQRQNRHHPKPPSGRLWRDLIIAKNDRTQNPYRGTRAAARDSATREAVLAQSF